MGNELKEVGVGIEAVAEKITELMRKREDALEIQRNASREVTDLTNEIRKLQKEFDAKVEEFKKPLAGLR